jgi:predicted N-acetyltransferase YhbS
MIVFGDETLHDVPAREALLDRSLGPARQRKSSERIRSGRLPAEGLSLVARDLGDGGDRLVGTVRLWHASSDDDRAALLLGPLAVDESCRAAGIGAALVQLAIARAADRGHGAILLVGDAPYYGRFGFSADLTRDLAMPGPFERRRLLGLELRPGALLGARGVIRAAGERVPTPVPATLLAA